jgi:hypothetical protein
MCRSLACAIKKLQENSYYVLYSMSRDNQVNYLWDFRTKIHRLDNGGSTNLWNVGLLRVYTALYPRKLSSSGKILDELKKQERYLNKKHFYYLGFYTRHMLVFINHNIL